jgi:hypothetical protein
MGRKGKDKCSAGFEAVRHGGSRRRRSRLRHTEIRGAMDAGKVTFEQANKQAYIHSNTRYTLQEIVHELRDYQ